MSRFEVIHIFHIIRNVLICIFEGKRKDVCIWNTETVSGFRSRKGIILLRRNEFYVGFYFFIRSNANSLQIYRSYIWHPRNQPTFICIAHFLPLWRCYFLPLKAHFVHSERFVFTPTLLLAGFVFAPLSMSHLKAFSCEYTQVFLTLLLYIALW